MSVKVRAIDSTVATATAIKHRGLVRSRVIASSHPEIPTIERNGNSNHSPAAYSAKAAASLARLNLPLPKSQTRKPTITTLRNGLTIVTEVDPHASVCALEILCKVGLNDETSENNGIHHLVEHMFYQGTRNKSALEVARQLDVLTGNNSNSYSDMEFSNIHGLALNNAGTNSHGALPQLINLTLNMIFYPSVSNLRKEKEAIKQEMLKYKDQCESYITDLLFRVVWREHPFGRLIVGKEEIIDAIQRPQVVNFIRRHYTPERLIISLVGNFDSETVIRQIKSFQFPKTNGKAEKTLPRLEYTPGICIKNRPINQTYMIFATPGVSVDDKDRYTFDVIEAALCQGSSSRLFQQIREERGFAYDVSLIDERNKLGGVFGIYTEIKSKDVDAVLEIIISQLMDIKANGLASKELKDTKKSLINALLIQRESTEHRALSNGKDAYYYGNAISLKERIEGIAAVTNKDIKDLAGKLFDPDLFSVIIVGPPQVRPVESCRTHIQDLIARCAG